MPFFILSFLIHFLCLNLASLFPSFFTHSSSMLWSYLKVWKQKGEEYRVTGYGGWSWISKTYMQRFVPRLPGNTNANYRKELEGLETFLGL